MTRCLQRLLPWAHLVLVAWLLVQLPHRGDPMHIDSGWQGLLQHDWIVGARWGEEAAFTYGPLGYALTWSVLLPDGIWARTLLGWALAIAIAAGLAAPARHLPPAWRSAWRIGLLVLAPFLGPSALFQAIAAAGIATLLALSAPGPDPAAAPRCDLWQPRVCGALGLLAAAGCAKFTYFALSVAVVATIALALLCMRRRGPALGVVALFAATFAGVWLLLGQRLGDLPVWLRASFEIAAGYNESMTFDGDAGERWGALLLLGVDTGLAAWLLSRRLRPEIPAASVRRWAGTAIALLGLCVTWKSGFVRHDTAHAAMFFGYAATVPFLLVLANQPLRPSRAMTVALAAAMLGAASLLGSGGWKWGGGYGAAIERAGEALMPVASVKRVQQDVRALQSGCPLPRLRRRVGDEPVDLMGHQQGVLFWAGFGVRHRPIFQSYSAYTPYLQRRNAEFFASASAPKFVFANVQSVDGHVPMNEDSGAWLVLLERYRPVMIEHTLLLLQLDPEARSMTRRRVADERVDWGQWFELPASTEWRELALGIERTILGSAIAALDRPGRLFLDVRLDAGREQTFQVAPLLARSAFLIDPLMRGTADLVAAHLGGSPPRVLAFRLRIERGCEAQYRDGVEVHLDARPPVDVVRDAAVRADLEAAMPGLTYPGFGCHPFAVEPAAGVVPLEAEPRNGVRAPAPCRLLFRWPGGLRRLSARFEILPDGRAAPDQSAVFRVEVGDARRTVFERALRPSASAADGGEQVLDLELDLAADTVVALATDGGPAGAAPCAWCAWRLVRIDPR